MINYLSYLIYATITAGLVIWVGYTFYKNGAHYLYDIFSNDLSFADSLNRMLLVGYYLINIGYVVFTVTDWQDVEHADQMIAQLSGKIGFIAVALGVIHFMNLFWIRKIKHY